MASYFQLTEEVLDILDDRFQNPSAVEGIVESIVDTGQYTDPAQIASIVEQIAGDLNIAPLHLAPLSAVPTDFPPLSGNSYYTFEYRYSRYDVPTLVSSLFNDFPTEWVVEVTSQTVGCNAALSIRIEAPITVTRANFKLNYDCHNYSFNGLVNGFVITAQVPLVSISSRDLVTIKVYISS